MVGVSPVQNRRCPATVRTIVQARKPEIAKIDLLRGQESGAFFVLNPCPAPDKGLFMQKDANKRTRNRENARKKGLIIVNTGNGKGKTTAALGIVMRAWGRGMRVGVIQFLKNSTARYGEIKAAKKMSIDWQVTGDGWTWKSRDLEESAALARHGWEVAKQHILSGDYDVLLLDEFTYPLYFGWLDTDIVIAWLRKNKPPMLHLIISGRYAPQALIDYADLVTEMREIKHPYQEQGIKAQPGIEF